MIQIRPISDLRNKFTEIEEIVTTSQSPVFLTKNGYGSMVVMSIKAYENITNNYLSEPHKGDGSVKKRSDEGGVVASEASLKMKLAH